ncbi:dihydroneopterin aldolase [Halanaerobium sp. Z-7514]|uniref:7,8-dihydroneopterin aldolase n=1 Tax=Halanaerobium polyolivorans TaxID=2886943 RepID=A0AAW4WZ50_9FIRM|nr:dihydroneopterin aldolase [Halanaerobium polyolivorans]MCC3144114.1 dihydroneopterin aldolase [Halanaerobium polyolivorans]RQD75222.1 MAG: dihydroneopterin aldolase [Halanaerobium sp. MSAO_Bac5]
MKNSIALNEMIFYAYHGVRECEKEQGQRFILNFKAEVDFEAAAVNDDLNKTVSYSEVYKVIRKIVEGNKYDLLESLAYKIICDLFTEFSLLDEIEIEVKKPMVPIPGILSSASVKMSRRRTEVEQNA